MDPVSDHQQRHHLPEATALVVDGVLYTLQGPPVQGVYEVVALDAATGRPFWTLEYKPQIEARPCCGRVSRGLAILGLGPVGAAVDQQDAFGRHPAPRERREPSLHVVGEGRGGDVEAELDRRLHLVNVLAAGPG